MKQKVDDETKEIIDSFIAEGYERLDDSELQLGKLSDGDVIPKLNSVFRLFHSVKGSAGFLNFENIKRLTHQAEALLEVFLKEKIAVSEDALDVVYTTIDMLRKLVETVERDYSDADAKLDISSQIAIIAACMQTLRANANPTVKETVPMPSAQPEQKTAVPENVIATSDLVTRDMIQRFLAECLDLVDKTEKIALRLMDSGNQGEEINDIFRAVHTIKGNSGFFGYALLELRCMEFESQLDGVRKGLIPVNEAFINTIISKIDGFRFLMNKLTIVTEGEALLTLPIFGAKTPDTAHKGGDSLQSAQPSGEYKPLGEILLDLGAVDELQVQRALDEQERPLGRILMDQGSVKSEDLSKALEIQRAQGSSPEHPQNEEIQRKEIRVDTSKLDKLFDLVGELITAEAMVLNSSDLKGLKLDNFSKSFSGLNKISREIQETTMMIRMIPLEGLFQKMTRLVRDLSRKFTKPVNFKVSGQDTEMDKNVIEQISDPLVHIIRNAIDHGVEKKDKRAKDGKAETGTINLDARYEGSEIWISVKDDGNGLDRKKILEKAVSVGLVTGDPALVTDRDVWKLIFEPGFSTAEVVSEVSGRGVGMDVVKKNMERIRGKVDIITEAGTGTEFVLKIPLTMAIIEGITISAGSNFYSIPLGDILEFFKAKESQLTIAEHGEEMVNLRGSIMPLIKFGEVFNIPDAKLDPTEGTIIVVHAGGRKACVLIDEVVGNQQIVVKSLSEFLGKVEGISGCSILGDGRVSFIIDTARLISRKLE